MREREDLFRHICEISGAEFGVKNTEYMEGFRDGLNRALKVMEKALKEIKDEK